MSKVDADGGTPVPLQTDRSGPLPVAVRGGRLTLPASGADFTTHSTSQAIVFQRVVKYSRNREVTEPVVFATYGTSILAQM
jgi:hypothetical protein